MRTECVATEVLTDVRGRATGGEDPEVGELGRNGDGIGDGRGAGEDVAESFEGAGQVEGFVHAGRRISASIKRTRTPFCARTMAVLMLVVVFPSWGKALVMRMILGGAPSEESSRDVRRAR